MSTQRAAAKLQDDSAGAALTETPMTTSQSVGGLSFHAHHTVRPLVICWELSVMTGRDLTTGPVRGHAAAANIR